ncbi:hypothetical protein GDO81_000281 [Engystomops pustulosus]|uniref:Uncharacterized protein n=1 Tax=Engystomops pustulosus TaxID=76066 RepID=A0AAV7D2T7_ENGPU|nr:hypothetical protein GDO81_000281 [Engystomops pustulosus]
MNPFLRGLRPAVLCGLHLGLINTSVILVLLSFITVYNITVFIIFTSHFFSLLCSVGTLISNLMILCRLRYFILIVLIFLFPCSTNYLHIYT